MDIFETTDKSGRKILGFIAGKLTLITKKVNNEIENAIAINLACFFFSLSSVLKNVKM